MEENKDQVDNVILEQQEDQDVWKSIYNNNLEISIDSKNEDQQNELNRHEDNNQNTIKYNNQKLNEEKKIENLDTYILNIIKNYIVKNSYSKIVKLCISSKDQDFKETDKSEQLLKFIRDKAGYQNLFTYIIKAQKNLQENYFKEKKKSKINNNKTNSIKVEIDESKENLENQENKKNKGNKETQENKEKNNEENNENNIENISMEIDLTEENQNKNSVKSENEEKEKGKEKEDENEKKEQTTKKSSFYCKTNGNSNDCQSMTFGLSVHLHKDENNNIYKYYLHHYMASGLAAYYCSDKKCTASAKYHINNKQFEIASEHSIAYNKHCYISKPFPNDQRLFKEFEKRNFKEAQLFRQANGMSNISWYN